VVFQSVTQVVAPADTLENVAASPTFPVGMLSEGCEVAGEFWMRHTNSANTKTMRWYAAGTLQHAIAATTQNVSRQGPVMMCRSTSLQIMVPSGITSPSTNPYIETTIDTDANTYPISITLQKQSAGEFLYLERYMIEVLP
jgi:hypothetical protein